MDFPKATSHVFISASAQDEILLEVRSREKGVYCTFLAGLIMVGRSNAGRRPTVLPLHSTPHNFLEPETELRSTRTTVINYQISYGILLHLKVAFRKAISIPACSHTIVYFFLSRFR